MSEQQNVATAGPARSGSEPESSPEELLELLRRERASFLNYKRRVEQERSADRERTAGEMVLRLLPVLDELDRALGQIPSELQTHPWAEGIALVHRQLAEALRQLGVERIGAEGDLFDPALHEAVQYQELPGVGDRRIGEVIRPGYRLGDRLLRPAQVSVVGPAETAEAETSRGRRHKGRHAAHPSEPDAQVGG
jgi:molecular chaperone GrpE